VIRTTVEFYDYVQHGSVKKATALLHGPHAKYVKDAQSASVDPLNKYDLEYECESIRSGIDSFCSLNSTYRILVGATNSRIEWGMIFSRESFNKQYVSMFKEFIEETNFEFKCRLLLDLFKLQIIFAGVSYD
jgi:hypothetical protein